MMLSAAWDLVKKLAPYLLIALLCYVVWNAGYQAADKIRVQQIATITAESAALIKVETEKKQQKEAEARLANEQLETSLDQSISTINALHVKLVSRLHDSKSSRKNTVPACPGAGVSEDSATHADLSERTVDIAYRADQIATYAQSCWAFVINNCGIKE